MLKALLMTMDGEPRPELLLFLKSVPGLALLNGSRPIPSLADRPAPELVIIDASAPGSDGATLLRELRRQLPTVRFLVLVGSLGQSSSALANGADRVLLTGFSTAEFFEALNELSLPA